MSGSILVNPWNTEEIADAIYESITLSERDRAKKFKHLYDFICRHTASYWGESFIRELRKASKAAEDMRSTPKLTYGLIQQDYKDAKKRIIVIHTDGALIPFAPAPFLAKPSRKVTNVLTNLAKDDKNLIFVVSGRGTFNNAFQI